MKSLLIVNHFLNGEKFNNLHSHLVKSAAKQGISMEIQTNLQAAVDFKKADFVLFWDKDVVLARRFEKAGVPVFNSSASIRKCDNKAETYVELNGVVKQPKTLVAPLTFFESDFAPFIDKAIEILGLPLVFKECYGSFGAQVYLCYTKQDILSHINGAKPFILQEFVAEAVGEDLRLEVVGGKVICAIRRKNKNDFRANITNGGIAEKYIPTAEQCQIATKACNALGLTLGGVDLLANDIVCEVNSNAHIMNIMNATGIDVAPVIFEEIKSKL